MHVRIVATLLVALVLSTAVVAFPADSDICQAACEAKDDGNTLKCCSLVDGGSKCEYGNWAVEVKDDQGNNCELKLSGAGVAFVIGMVILGIACIAGGIACCCCCCSCCPVAKRRRAREEARLRLLSQPGYGAPQPAYGAGYGAANPPGLPAYNQQQAYNGSQSSIYGNQTVNKA